MTTLTGFGGCAHTVSPRHRFVGYTEPTVARKGQQDIRQCLQIVAACVNIIEIFVGTTLSIISTGLWCDMAMLLEIGKVAKSRNDQSDDSLQVLISVTILEIVVAASYVLTDRRFLIQSSATV